MHHPGPPRFVHVGESVELAPRAPDPDASYAWRIVDAPDDSDATVGEGAVVHLAPDVPGTYRLELEAPDGNHRQTVRAFPDSRKSTQFRVDPADVDGDVSDAETASVIGQFNDFTMGIDRAEFEDGAWVLDVELPPGDHEGIFAFDDEFDPFASSEVTVEGAGRPRVSLDARRDGDDVVVTATARPAPAGSEPDVEFHLDGRDDLSEDDVAIDGDELRVPVDELPELVRVHAVAVAESEVSRTSDASGVLASDAGQSSEVERSESSGETGSTRHSIADALEISADGDETAFHRPADPPEWVRDATIYEIFVREFAGETVDTTFEEIERRVPYLEHLGVDVVWLTPVLESPTRHGYHITDMFDTADDLGTRAEFESLVDRLHEADIRVVFDLVINHTSRDHPAFQMHRAGVPEYADHYERIPAEQDTTDVDWAGDDAPGHYFTWTRIPNVNFDSLAVREWMLDVVDEWAPVVDGFRCDVAWGVPHGFWKEVRERVKSEDNDFLLLDETVPKRDARFRENEFDFHYDADLYFALRDIGNGDAPADVLFDALTDTQRHGYPDEAVHMRYVENHDEDRYIDECGRDALRAAVAATFTLPGVPLIYYGQERGVEDYRGTMRWHDGDQDLTEFHRRLVSLRDDHPALRSDGVDPVDVAVRDGDPDRVVAYERASEDEHLLVVLNFGETAATVVPDVAMGETDLLSGTDVDEDGGLRVGDAVVVELAEE